MKKVFIENLPKWESGTNKGKINWTESIGTLVRFIYDDIEDWIKIKSYVIKGQILIIIYNDEEYKIRTGEFVKCQLGVLLGKITNDFKIKKGSRYIDKKRDLTIIGMEHRNEYNKDGTIRQNKKWYNYYCNICRWAEGWLNEGNLIAGDGCSCCRGLTVVEGINDIPTTTPWIIPYFQGGYDEAKLYTRTGGGNPDNRGGFINPICPDCKRIKSKKMRINDIYRNHSIACSCGDCVPYSEKIMFSVLEQLKLDFQTQLTRDSFNWCDKYRYDFYFELNSEKYVIETNGNQHYEKGFDTCGGKTPEEVQQNDRLKKELALNNGIKPENYIVIDCRYSTFEYIKQNIFDNIKLNKLFNLNKIDWFKVEEFTLSNLVKVACDYKKNNPNMTTKDIGKLMGYQYGTIRNWLKKGTKIGWCNYDSKEEIIKNGIKAGKSRRKPMEIFKDGISLGIFESASEIEGKSEKLFGVRLNSGSISRVCNNKIREYKGFTFKYI